ncbi:MAG: hypothetical protein KAQ83_03335 [Nanoarchaeota archaeon]|nr:hypothetical protein [Nanoarchaeota archaeon]
MQVKPHHKVLAHNVISKVLFLLIIVTGAILTYNGLAYSNMNITINGTILLILGITIYYLFHGNPFEKGFIYNHKKKKGPKLSLR